jgi:uncharacterized membrane protein
VRCGLVTRSRHAAHLWAMFSIGWALLIYAERESNTVLVLMLIVGIGLILADGFAHATMQRLTRFAHPLAACGCFWHCYPLLHFSSTRCSLIPV